MAGDVTAVPDLVHGRARAGPVRFERPVYVDLLPPCNVACPAGEDIQGWLADLNASDPEAAWRRLVRDNPFPAIHGRVCYHPCEAGCNRASLDSPVSIHAVERFLGDMALEQGWRFPPPGTPTGRRVLVVGAGPSGLSAAYHLARLGHSVEVRDAGDQPGGMMRYGIPAYRLPRHVLDAEVARIEALGVAFTTGHKVTDLEEERRRGGFDAVFVAVGAHLSKRVDIPAMDAGPIVDAVSLLRRVASGERPQIGRRVAVYGGGNTARNVYPVAGTEVETILADLKRSFDQHVEDETTRVGELLEAAGANVDPEVVAARMAIETGRAPARVHPMLYRHPEAKGLRAVYRHVDRLREWNDSHHGWPAARRESRPVRPPRKFSRQPPSIPELLAGYDQMVEAIIAELAEAGQDGQRRAAGAYQLAGAIAVHDSIVGGTLCPLLEALPEARPTSAVLRRGCQERAQLLREWSDLIRHNSPSDLFEKRAADADRVIDELIASFRTHETHETEDVSTVVEQLGTQSWKSGGTGLISPYLLLEWPNPDPGFLAAHMALWAEKAPTHAHPLLSRHPSNRLLRNVYRRVDQVQDRRRARRGWPSLT